jgi:hypothetical protein
MHLALDPAMSNGSITSKQESIMTIANVSQGSARGLPQALRTAQEAIHLPEVQEMLRRLSEYKLGIFMPHMHDEQTGQFQPLPDEVMQVESGLEVSFQPTEEIASQTGRFLPVGWFWRAGASTPVAVCEMVWGETPGDTERHDKHKMIKGN